jgi:AcrR family transcriptional regulator
LTSAAAIRIAAMKLFAEPGYAGVTVRQIASAAGVSPALVIHHYGSKERLRAVLEERVAAFVESMLAELARVVTDRPVRELPKGGPSSCPRTSWTRCSAAPTGSGSSGTAGW